MNKKKSKVLAFLLATAMLIPSTNGIVSAAELKEDKNVSIQENVQKVEEDKNQSEVNYVAMIGNQKYETLQKAFEAVPNNEQVKIVIQKDIKDLKTTDMATLEAGKSIILDMNGKNITVSSEEFVGRPIVNNGTMTVTGNGTISSENAGTTGYGAILNSGTLVIENGKYLGNVKGNGSAIKNNNNGTLTIKDGYFNGTSAIYNAGKADIYGGIFESESCSQCGPWGYTINTGIESSVMHFYNGTVIGVQGAFAAGGGTCIIEDGTFETVACKTHGKEAGFYGLYVAGSRGKASCIVNGGTFKSASKVAIYVGNGTPGDGGECKEATLEINGGKFISGLKDGTVVQVNSTTTDGNPLGDFKVKGGEYSSSVEDYLDPSLKTEVVSQDGMHSYYPTVSDALDKAPTGSDITDLENPPGTAPIEVELSDKNGTGKEFELKADKDGNVKLPRMSRSGYNFKGWRDSKTGELYNADDTLNIEKNPDLVLEAVWEEIYIPSTPSKPSKPTYTHEEIIGSDRYETAAKIADKLGSYDNVVLVNAESSMSDGLAASGLAGKENGAILLTKKDSIPQATMDRIKKVKKVYIIGGEAAISAKVANEITAVGIKVERLGGKTRVETSEIVAKKLGNYSDAFVVNGFKGEADAMSASAIAAKKGAPILLTNGKTSTHAKKSGVEYYVIGGDNVVDKSIADKYDAEVLAGKDRYATNKEVINEFYSGSDKVYIANGDKLVDALTASPLAKKDGIVLVNEKSDKSILKGKNTVQVGGMDFKIEFEK